MSHDLVVAAPPEARSATLTHRAAASYVGAFLALLALVARGFGTEAIVDALVTGVLVLLSTWDLEHRIIPNRIVVPAWGAVLFTQLALHPHHLRPWLLGSFGAGVFFLVLALIRPGSLGMGDVKLALLIGAALGASVLPALLVGTLASGVLAVTVLVREGSSARKQTIPLGPFLAFGAIVVILFGG